MTEPRAKYGNVKVERDNVVFDSKAEARRYEELKLLQAAGAISSLELQPRFDIVVNGVRIGFYKADFRYRERTGRLVVEDTKGVRTPVYRLKAKLVKALYGIDIVEVE